MREKAKQAVWRGIASVNADMGDDLERGPADNHCVLSEIGAEMRITPEERCRGGCRGEAIGA